MKEYAVLFNDCSCDFQMEFFESLEDSMLACQSFANEMGYPLEEWRKWENPHNTTCAILEYKTRIQSHSVSVFKIT
jgi:hypothetical protein